MSEFQIKINVINDGVFLNWVDFRSLDFIDN